jgi:hypothetical protein
LYFSPGVKECREDFFNFDVELSTLVRELSNQTTRMIVVKGVRRTGKSSLIRVGLSMSGLPHVILDARRFEYFSVDAFYEILADSLARLLESRRSVSKYLGMIRGVRVSLGLILFGIKPSSLGFTALGISFHWDPLHRAPPTRGNPNPQLLHHLFLKFIAVGKPPHPGPPKTPLLGLYIKPASRGVPQ